MPLKKWTVPKLNKPLASSIAEECGIDPFVCLILTSRGMSDPVEIEEFLSDDAPIGDPYELKDMFAAVERIRLAIDNFEKIAIYGDYDCDGVTATTLLYSYLVSCSADVIYYIPKRSDGYGMSVSAVDFLHSKGVNLIITVDNGISANKEIAYANELGMSVVVTDHHLQSDVLPDAVAVVDPHREDCPSEFKDIAGVGVAFKLVCALASRPPEEMLLQYGDLVAIGTVADVMPLVGENRAFVKCGAALISNAPETGIAALLKAAGADKRPVSATSISFTLAPRINAAGRIGSSERAVNLLLESDENKAAMLANKICDDNILRQKIEREIAQAAVEAVYAHNMEYDRVIVVSGKDWHHGVVGIAASRLVEKFSRPVIMLSEDGETASGSGRSVAGFDLFNAVRTADNILIRYGGHTLAAGMTLKTEDVPEFRRIINQYAAENYPIMPFPELKLDCKLNPAAISLDLAKTLSVLSPFGSGNPVPVFGLFGLKIDNIQGMGGDKHLKLFMSRDGAVICGMLFGCSPADFTFKKGDVVNCAVTLDINVWQGEENLSVQIKDIHPASINDEFYSSERKYESFRRNEFDGLDSQDIMITRDDAAAVFRAVRSSHDGNIKCDSLIFQLCAVCGYAKTMTAVDVLCELGILARDGDNITIGETGKKVDLDSSKILAQIKEKIQS